MDDFSWGVANRGCSIRVGRMVPVEKCGYYEASCAALASHLRAAGSRGGLPAGLLELAGCLGSRGCAPRNCLGADGLTMG
jgi:hypothetical protein